MDLALIAKMTVILGVGLITAYAAHRAAASVRALILTGTFGALLALPVAVAVTPSHVVTLPMSSLVRGSAPKPDDVAPGKVMLPLADLPASTSDAATGTTISPGRIPSLRPVLATIWLVGVALTLVPLMTMLLRSRRIRLHSTSWGVPSPSLGGFVTEAMEEGISIRVSDAVDVPMAYGVLRPAIILPERALGWADHDLRCALLHEREHLRRRDWLVLTVVRTVAALYWFHPLVWLAWARLRLEVERACDDAVLRQSDGSAYAEQLVTLARHMRQTTPVPLLSMASKSDLRARVSALLDGRLSRGPAGLRARLAVAMGVCLFVGIVAPLRVVTVSAAQKGRVRELPVPGETGKIEGVIYDPTGAPMPGLLLVLEPCFTCGSPNSRPEAEGATRTDRNGRFRFDGMPPGQYGISSPIDFFPPVTVTVPRGEAVKHDVTLTITPLEQEFTVCARCATFTVPESLAKEFAADATDALDHPVSAPRPANGWEYYRPGMGVYPAVALEKELEGTVIVEGRIGLDGVPTGMKVLSATHRELGQATLDALATEFWEPGRIRGVAFEVPFRFLIRYVMNE